MSKLALQRIAKEKKEKTGRLDLGSCVLRELPKELLELTALQKLDLHSNQIKDISFLEKLTSLQMLDLSSNRLKDISFLEKLTSLQVLYLSNNQISDVSFLEKLTSLRILHLSNNQISDYSYVRKLISLQVLHLNNNQISDYSFLEKFNSLQTLYLGNNQISDISFLEKLTCLQTLYLRNNQINDISPLRILARKYLSKGLDISKNNIKDLTPLLPLIERGKPIKWECLVDSICVQENPLKIPPPEVVKKGNDAVLKYFQDLKKQGADYLYEAKLLIVGEGESGKTTLAWKLKDIKAPMPDKGDDRTKGIDIQTLDIKNVVDKDRLFRMNAWDFGGQEIYHSTHQFFLTKRSLYLIVNNTRSNLTDFNHWVQTINLFSDNSPILIVQNEVGGSVTDFDLRGLQQYFSNILCSIDADLSNTEDGRIQKIIREIHHQIQQLDHVGMELPKQWVAIRHALEAEAEKAPYISNTDFYTICQKHQVSEKEAIQRIAAIFHDLGVLLFFQEDPILKRLVVLQNSWVTKGVYAILDNEKIRQQKGRFSEADAQQIWEDTPFENKEMELLQMMIKFELCYRIPYQRPVLYVSPQLLPVERPKYEWDKQQNMIIYYEYEFMPKGLLGRLIVRLHRYIKDIDQFAWRNGCIFRYEKTDAQVIETYGSKKIEICIQGKHHARLAMIVTKEMDELNTSFEKLTVEKLIPCNCQQCKNNASPHFFKFKNLMNRKEKGKRTIECDVSFEDVLVQEILDGAFEANIIDHFSIPVLIKAGKLEAALNQLKDTSSNEALLLMNRFQNGKREHALGKLSPKDWSVIQQQIANGLLELHKDQLMQEE